MKFVTHQPPVYRFLGLRLMDHYTSMGISNDAREFLDAAHLVRRDKPVWFGPTYFLVCQSIELSLKAFLRASGYSAKQLRRIGHDLDQCSITARPSTGYSFSNWTGSGVRRWTRWTAQSRLQGSKDDQQTHGSLSECPPGPM
jgi:hypothetical protein